MTTLLAWVLWSQLGWAWYLGAPPTEPVKEQPAQIAFASLADCQTAAARVQKIAHPTLTYRCLPSTVDPRAVPIHPEGGSR